MDISTNNMYNLIDVTKLIIPEEDPKFFNEDESFDLYQTCTGNSKTNLLSAFFWYFQPEYKIQNTPY